jgi:hypothetical protein
LRAAGIKDLYRDLPFRRRMVADDHRIRDRHVLPQM